jgi:hypothetical protein
MAAQFPGHDYALRRRGAMFVFRPVALQRGALPGGDRACDVPNGTMIKARDDPDNVWVVSD